MAKKMVSYRLEEELILFFTNLAASEDRTAVFHVTKAMTEYKEKIERENTISNSQ